MPILEYGRRTRTRSRVFRRWHKEIFADLAAVLLGGHRFGLGHE
jgi:hypothetical protein